MTVVQEHRSTDDAAQSLFLSSALFIVPLVLLSLVFIICIPLSCALGFRRRNNNDLFLQDDSKDDGCTTCCCCKYVTPKEKMEQLSIASFFVGGLVFISAWGKP